jgi:hypothetical protein
MMALERRVWLSQTTTSKLSDRSSRRRIGWIQQPEHSSSVEVLLA